MHVLQVLIAFGVVCGAIWYEETYHYEINPLISGAWGFMAAYGFTLLVDRYQRWRSRSRVD